MNVHNYLHSKGFNYTVKTRHKGPEAIFNCPFCGDKDNHFGVSLADGAFQCMRKSECGRYGSWTDLQRLLNDKPIPLDSEYKIMSVPKKYKKPVVHSDPLTQVLYDFHEKRKISKDTLKFFKIGLKDNNIMVPHFEKGELIFVKYRPLNEKKFWNDKDNKPILFNMDACINEPILRITEGHWDTMAAKEMGLNSVSVPNGTGDDSWIQTCWDYIDKFNNIYLYFDNDNDKEINAGQDAVSNIVKRLGEWRCYNVILPYKDINECLMQGLNINDILECEKNAIEYKHEMVKSIKDYEKELIEYNLNPKRKYGYEISIKGLQNILLGWREGELTILSGYPGSGKSTYLNQEMLFQITKNKLRVCILSLELLPRVYLSWMVNQYCKKKHIDENDITKTTNELDGNIYIIPQVGVIKIDVMMDAIKYATRKYGVKLFVIDSMMRIQFDSRYELNEQKNFIDTCVGFAREYNVHIFLVVHPRKGTTGNYKPDEMDLYGSSNILNLTDNLIFLYKDEKNKRTELYSRKHRAWGSNDSVNLNFTSETRTFSEEV